MRPDEYDAIFQAVSDALQDFARMNAHEQLRKQINAIHADLNMRGIHSKAIEEATYAIETLSRAYMEPGTPIDWRRQYNFTKMERAIAEVFYKRLGYAIATETMLESIYSPRVGKADNLANPLKTMQVLICKMRKRLKHSPFEIETDFGVGYRMVLRPSSLALTALQELQAH